MIGKICVGGMSTMIFIYLIQGHSQQEGLWMPVYIRTHSEEKPSKIIIFIRHFAFFSDQNKLPFWVLWSQWYVLNKTIRCA